MGTMSYIRHKTRGSKTYAYEITAYYDKKLKRQRQKTKYLGVVTESGIERKRINSVPRSVFDYGDVAVTYRLANDTKIADTLTEVYGREVTNMLLALASNKLIRETALTNFKTWYEGTCLKTLTPLHNPSSQNLSRALDTIGEDDTSMARFFNTWKDCVDPKRNIAYDLTSVSSSSDQINSLEYGKNRDHDGLPQINLGLVSSLDAHLPLYFKTFPGSINDVVTMKNLTTEIKAMEIQNVRYILDRGFCSKKNIFDMVSAGIDFVMGLSYRFKEAQNIISKNRLNANSPDRAVMFRGKIQYVGEGVATIGDVKVNYYHFFDEERRARETETFYTSLLKIESELNGKVMKDYENPRKVFEDKTKNFKSFFKWSFNDGVLHLSRKKNAISRRTNRMGKLILLYTGDIDWETVLSFYRDRDQIEKLFRIFKTDIGGTPMRVHKETTMKGSLLVSFISLVMYADLLNRMRASKLTEKYSVERLFLELLKLKKVQLVDGNEIITECTKRIRDILVGLGLEDMVPTN